MTPLIGIAWRNIRLHWRHSLAALLAISAGFISLSLFQCYMLNVEGIYDESYTHRAMYAHVLIEMSGAQKEGKQDPTRYELRKADQNFIENFLKQQPEFMMRTRVLNILGMITNGKVNTVFTGYAYDVAQGAKIREPHWGWDVSAGKPLNLSDDPNVIVTGKRLGTLLGCKATSSETILSKSGGYIPKERPFECTNPSLQLSVTTDSGQVNAMDFIVVGIRDAAFKEIDTRFVSMPLETAQKLFDTDGVSYYAVLLKDGSDAGKFAKRFNQAALVGGHDISATRWQKHNVGDLYNRSVEFLGIFRDFVVAIIVVIAGLSVLNSLVKIVRERQREIGTLRSMGFLSGQIVFMFACEAVFLSVLGSAVGLVVTLLVSIILNTIAFPYKAGMLAEPVPFQISISPTVYFWSAAFLCGVSIVAAIIPSHRTTRAKIADNLIHV